MFRNDILPGQTVVAVIRRHSRGVGFINGETFVVARIELRVYREPMIWLMPTAYGPCGPYLANIQEGAFLRMFAPHRPIARLKLREKPGTNKFKQMIMNHQNAWFAHKLEIPYPRR